MEKVRTIDEAWGRTSKVESRYEPWYRSPQFSNTGAERLWLAVD